MLLGIDFSSGGGLTTGQIKGGGKHFVARYLSGGNSKDISHAELANYQAAGIPVIFVWETDGIMSSFAQGASHAWAAVHQLASLGAAGAVVFFAADAASMPDLHGYMAGVVSVIGRDRTGIYGGIGSVSGAFNAGLARYGWQTLAWSNGQWDNRALIRQVQNAVQFGPAQVDLDQAGFWSSTKVLGLSDDFGQFPSPSSSPQPDPKPPPPPAPAPAPVPPPEDSDMPELDTNIASHPLLIPFGAKSMDLLSVAPEATPCVVSVTFLGDAADAKEYSLSWGAAGAEASIPVPAGVKKARLDVVSGGGLPVSVRFNQ